MSATNEIDDGTNSASSFSRTFSAESGGTVPDISTTGSGGGDDFKAPFEWYSVTITNTQDQDARVAVVRAFRNNRAYTDAPFSDVVRHENPLSRAEEKLVPSGGGSVTIDGLPGGFYYHVDVEFVDAPSGSGSIDVDFAPQ